jgi:hypothetical protein
MDPDPDQALTSDQHPALFSVAFKTLTKTKFFHHIALEYVHCDRACTRTFWRMLIIHKAIIAESSIKIKLIIID